MFNILSHKRNANKNNFEISTKSSGYYQGHKQQQMLAGIREKGILIHRWQECELV
jgi:hypothetical protein